ncbi:alanine dehydrogenase, putative, partial [Eimeria maxima]
MIVGCPKEIKPQEGRVGLLPADVAELVRFKHTVLIQKNAGLAAGATDEQYRAVGAQIIEHAEEIFARSDLIVKVKEPLPSEFVHIRSGQVVFTYFHFASSRQLTEAMLQCEAVCIAYEGVEDSAGRLPLLEPMSEVAGHMAVQEGMHFLSAHSG